jgi:hypothetical protein
MSEDMKAMLLELERERYDLSYRTNKKLTKEEFLTVLRREQSLAGLSSIPKGSTK